MWRGRHCPVWPRKLCYPTREEAVRVAAATWLRFGRKTLPYLCSHPDEHWHVGKPKEG